MKKGENCKHTVYVGVCTKDTIELLYFSHFNITDAGQFGLWYTISDFLLNHFLFLLILRCICRIHL